MAKRIIIKKEVPATSAKVEDTTPVQAAPAAPVVKAKKVKEPESAETKWQRRLLRWQKKAELAGVDTKKLMLAAAA